MKDEIIKIILIDDHAMVIEGMKSILKNIPDMEVVAVASNATDTMRLLLTHKIDIAFVDINLPDMSGIELCSKIRKEWPEIKVIGLSTFKQRSYISQMIANGASGYLIKSADIDEIKDAVRKVYAGFNYYSPEIDILTLTDSTEKDEMPTLTRREKEIVQLISEGLTNKEIADKLFLSTYTVDTHRKNLLTKFNVSNTALLVKTAAQLGFL